MLQYSVACNFFETGSVLNALRYDRLILPR
jgi:hypothetical protein